MQRSARLTPSSSHMFVGSSGGCGGGDKLGKGVYGYTKPLRKRCFSQDRSWKSGSIQESRQRKQQFCPGCFPLAAVGWLLITLTSVYISMKGANALLYYKFRDVIWQIKYLCESLCSISISETKLPTGCVQGCVIRPFCLRKQSFILCLQTSYHMKTGNSNLQFALSQQQFCTFCGAVVVVVVKTMIDLASRACRLVASHVCRVAVYV